VLLLAAGAVLTITVVTSLGRWLDAVPPLARSPLVPVLAGMLAAGLVALLLARSIATRRALRSRVAFVLLPADVFDPAPEAVERFAAALARSRRALRGLLDARASAVRVQLDADDEGRLRYIVEVPAHARAALRAALGAYGGAVELHEIERPTIATAGVVVRAELVLARPSVEPLRMVGLDPDPLAGFAAALDQLRPADGEAGVVCVDLLPMTAARRRHLRRRELRAAGREHRDPRAAGPLGELLDGGRGGSGGRQTPAELVERRAGQRALTSKLGSPAPLFAMQILARVSTDDAARAKDALASLLSAFDVFAGENHLRAAGVRLPGGATFLGVDLPLRRARFDRRMEIGLFRPSRRRFITPAEIAGLLAPPSARCGAPNVQRSGGIVPPAPRRLRTFAGQRDLLPIGRVTTPTGTRTVGVPLADTYFSYLVGRSRWGKTETATGQFIHLARAGHGGMFIDPHHDALVRIKSFLTEPGVRERVVEIDLTADEQPGWNPFATRRPPHEQVEAIVDAIASAQQWSEINTRALAITTQAAQALAELAVRLPPELKPTIFQLASLLSDDDWRAVILPHVAPATRAFFMDRFPRLSREAITPVTHLIDRLRAAPAIAALLGQPVSTYDARESMDRGHVVLVCPGRGRRARVVANLFVFEQLHALTSRDEIPPERRRPFYVYMDEAQEYDGSSSGNLASLFESSGKFGGRVVVLNQQPERLTPATRTAIVTNRSHLLATALDAKGAALIARELSSTLDPDVIARLDRYEFVGTATIDGRPSTPFRMSGVAADELHADAHRPDELPALDAAIQRTARRRPIAEVLDALDHHDERIAAHLRSQRRPRRREAAHGRRTIELTEATR
jgi:hypothetical protein